jgi:hypothetical protein
MTEVLTKAITDCSTGVTTIIPLNEEELAQLELDRTAAQEREAEREAEATALAEAKASAEAKLTALGLTSDEVAAIIGR